MFTDVSNFEEDTISTKNFKLANFEPSFQEDDDAIYDEDDDSDCSCDRFRRTSSSCCGTIAATKGIHHI